MKGFFLLIVFSAFFVLPVCLKAQDSSLFRFPLQMDSVTVKAVRGGWDVNAFIRRIQTDTTFYKAFRALNLVSYNCTNDIRLFDKRKQVAASLFSHTRQKYQDGCRTMEVLDERTTGDFYKRKGGYRYFTAELYAYLFFTIGRICGENDIVGHSLQDRQPGLLGKSEWQLKQLVFNPGGKIRGVPFVGNKASIFEPDIARFYDFKLHSVDYEGEACYLFQAIPKPEHVKDVVYNELSTWFRKSDYSIMARDYYLSYDAGVYDFDVHMKVKLQTAGNKLLPSVIDYDGNWHVFSKDRERAKFTATFIY